MSVLTITSLAFTGEHRGVSISYTQGSTLRCYRMERTAIGKEPIEEYLGHTGVYVLYNETDIYIGEATNVFNRLKSHNKTKKFWTDVLCFTTIDHSVDQGDAKYLEARLIKLANATGRYTVHNSKEETVHKSTEIKRLTRESLLQLILQFGEFFNVQINVPVDSTVPVAEKSVVTITPTTTVTETVAEPAPTPVQELKVTDFVLTDRYYSKYETAKQAIDLRNPVSFEILKDQLSGLQVSKSNKVLVFDSLEHAFALAQCYELPRTNITVQTASSVYARIAKKAGFNVYEANTPIDYPNMQFDIVIGNPPYQEGENKGTGGKQIWHHFVDIAFNVCKPKGFVSLVHPNMWRMGKSSYKEAYESITSRNLTYLNMNSAGKGKTVFGAETTFDYYVVENVPYKGKTKLVYTDDTDSTCDISGKPFIPHCNYEFFDGILAKPGETKYKFITGGKAFGNTRLKKEPTDTHTQETIYNLVKSGPQIYYANSDDFDYKGMPKLLTSNGGGGNIFVDPDGRYPISNFTYGVFMPKEDLESAYNFFMDPAVREKLRESRAGSELIERGLMANLRENFWKPRT